MTKHYILSLLLLVSVAVTYGQKFGDYYVSISIESTEGGRLKFLSDTTVEQSSIPRHMRSSIKIVHKYTATDTTIKIFPAPSESRESNATGIYIQPFTLVTPINLTKIKGGFIDYSKSLIYVRQKDFGDNPDIAYIIDGKTYIQNMGVTDGYGSIKERPKINKALQKRLKGLNIDNCSIEIVRGVNAYKKFGIERVFGAIVITTTK